MSSNIGGKNVGITMTQGQIALAVAQHQRYCVMFDPTPYSTGMQSMPVPWEGYENLTEAEAERCAAELNKDDHHEGRFYASQEWPMNVSSRLGYDS